MNHAGYLNGEQELNGYTNIEPLKPHFLNNSVSLSDSEMTDNNNSCKVNGHSDLEKEAN